jgi:hypothetical protein
LDPICRSVTEAVLNGIVSYRNELATPSSQREDEDMHHHGAFSFATRLSRRAGLTHGEPIRVGPVTRDRRAEWTRTEPIRIGRDAAHGRSMRVPRRAWMRVQRGEFDILSIYRQQAACSTALLSPFLPRPTAASSVPCNRRARHGARGTALVLRVTREESAMSQVNVERVIGQLVTDEGFRRRFGDDPSAVLQELLQSGVQLNPCETYALLRIDIRALARAAKAIDPTLQKSDLRG